MIKITTDQYQRLKSISEKLNSLIDELDPVKESNEKPRPKLSDAEAKTFLIERFFKEPL